jgi:uncharacterized alpha-E superfamily protein
MLSRTADSLFWMNCYMERADSILRVIKTNYILSLDKNVNGNTNWRSVLELFATIDEDSISAAENNTGAAIFHIISDPENINSLKAIVGRARENARGIQDYVTKEVWEQINQLYHIVSNSAFDDRLKSINAIEIIDSLTSCLVMYTGVVEVTMPRGMGWSFMNMGKLIERCLLTIEMTDKQFRGMKYDLNNYRDILYWRYLLLSLSGYELNLKNYRTQNYNQNVLHQVLFNPDFSRSLIYSLNRIERYLNYIIDENNYSNNISLMHSFGRLHSFVRYTDFEKLSQFSLKDFFADVKDHLNNFIKILEHNFFSYS